MKPKFATIINVFYTLQKKNYIVKTSAHTANFLSLIYRYKILKLKKMEMEYSNICITEKHVERNC